jgi:hypothetical protein
MNWYIVVGRRWGDDEATASKLQAESPDKAWEAFKEQMRDPWKDDDKSGDWAENDGPGTVYIDNVFDCGAVEPKEV